MLTDYGLTKKVFAVALDNASSNISAMRKLRHVISKYLGIEVVDYPVESQSDNVSSLTVVNSMFLHQRCILSYISTYDSLSC